MELLWIGNAVLLLVVAPVVILILRSVLQPANEIDAHAEQIATVGTSINRNLDSVGELQETRRLVGETVGGLRRYGAALDRIL